MSTLQIRKLESGAFKHVDSIDGDFFLGRFNFKQEFNKAFLVEAYGAKRREYSISDITVYNYLGTAEIFTNWTDLFNRLTELGYTGIDTNGMIPIVDVTEILITNASVTGTYNIDWSAGDVWRLTLVGNTNLTFSNLPPSGTTETKNIHINGNYTLGYPADFTDYITGFYIGSATLNTITAQVIGVNEYKVQIVQPD